MSAGHYHFPTMIDVASASLVVAIWLLIGQSETLLIIWPIAIMAALSGLALKALIIPTVQVDTQGHPCPHHHSIHCIKK